MQNTEKQTAILTAIDEMQFIADPEVYQKTLTEVLIEFLGNTDLDSDNRGRITAIFGGLNSFLDDLVKAEA